MSIAAPEPATVLAIFDEGVSALARLAEEAAAAEAWDRTACGSWTVAEVVRHELDVIGWYHDWLDRALEDDPSPAWPIEELDDRAEAGVRSLAGTNPDEAVTQFVSEAKRYAERLEPSWDVPFGYPRGTCTPGLHAGVAAAEWHLHAWDIAGALGTDHRPSNPGDLLIAVTACRAVAPGGLRPKVERALAPITARAHPWEALLYGSGRRPADRGDATLA